MEFVGFNLVGDDHKAKEGISDPPGEGLAMEKLLKLEKELLEEIKRAREKRAREYWAAESP